MKCALHPKLVHAEIFRVGCWLFVGIEWNGIECGLDEGEGCNGGDGPLNLCCVHTMCTEFRAHLPVARLEQAVNG